MYCISFQYHHYRLILSFQYNEIDICDTHIFKLSVPSFESLQVTTEFCTHHQIYQSPTCPNQYLGIYTHSDDFAVIVGE